jgi:hypothetical protein
VKDCKTLRDSFKDYIQVETLKDDNKYQAEGYGLQVRCLNFFFFILIISIKDTSIKDNLQLILNIMKECQKRYYF